MTTETDQNSSSALEVHVPNRKLPDAPRSLLLADDEHLVVSGLAANLKELGYLVLGPVSDGEEAIELCRRSMPDMALLDIRMPGTDGITAARTIFNELAIPVVLFSAYSEPEYVTSGSEAGIFGYLLKPVTHEQLRIGISVAWHRYVDHVEHSTEILKLRQRLEDRKLIEQAKWIVIRRKNLTEPDAMKLLQRQARNKRRKLSDVARSIIENEDLFGDE